MATARTKTRSTPRATYASTLEEELRKSVGKLVEVIVSGVSSTGGVNLVMQGTLLFAGDDYILMNLSSQPAGRTVFRTAYLISVSEVA